MEILLLLILTLITITVIVLSYLERRDLVDRLMSRNITEYKSIKEEPNDFGDDDSNLIPLADAKKEILNEEV